MSGETADGRRVLVLNDDPDMLDVLSEALARQGYEVHAEQQHAAALRCVRSVQPAVVVLDLVWQGQPDGWAILEQLQQDPTTQRVPVILTTAADMRLRPRRRWLRDHGVHVLLKPFALSALLEAVAARMAEQPPRPDPPGNAPVETH